MYIYIYMYVCIYIYIYIYIYPDHTDLIRPYRESVAYYGFKYAQT